MSPTADAAGSFHGLACLMKPPTPNPQLSGGAPLQAKRIGASERHHVPREPEAPLLSFHENFHNWVGCALVVLSAFELQGLLMRCFFSVAEAPWDNLLDSPTSGPRPYITAKLGHAITAFPVAPSSLTGESLYIPLAARKQCSSPWPLHRVLRASGVHECRLLVQDSPSDAQAPRAAALLHPQRHLVHRIPSILHAFAVSNGRDRRRRWPRRRRRSCC